MHISVNCAYTPGMFYFAHLILLKTSCRLVSLITNTITLSESFPHVFGLFFFNCYFIFVYLFCIFS